MPEKSHLSNSAEQRRMQEKLEHIHMVEYTRDLGPYHRQWAAVFDDRLVSEQEVRDCIIRGEAHHPCIVFMDKDQFENVFRRHSREEIPTARRT